MRYSFVADHFQYLASLGPITLAHGARGGAARACGERRYARARSALGSRSVPPPHRRQSEATTTCARSGQARSRRIPAPGWRTTTSACSRSRRASSTRRWRTTAPRSPQARRRLRAQQPRPHARRRRDVSTTRSPCSRGGALRAGNAEAWRTRQRARGARGAGDEAIAAYACASRPAVFADARGNLGNVMFFTGGPTRRSSSTSAVALDPRVRRRALQLGVALASRDRLDEAEASSSRRAACDRQPARTMCSATCSRARGDTRKPRRASVRRCACSRAGRTPAAALAAAEAALGGGAK